MRRRLKVTLPETLEDTSPKPPPAAGGGLPYQGLGLCFMISPLGGSLEAGRPTGEMRHLNKSREQKV